MNFAREIIRRAFLAGATVAVDDGDGEYVTYPAFQKAFDATQAVTECNVRITVPGRKREWMLSMTPGELTCAPDETAVDFTDGGWITETWEKINAEQEAQG